MEKHLLPFSSIMMLQKGGVLNLRFLSFDRLIILLHLIMIWQNDKKDFVHGLIHRGLKFLVLYELANHQIMTYIENCIRNIFLEDFQCISVITYFVPWIQVILCKKHSVLHQLTQFKMADCSLNYKFSTRKLQA